MAGDRAVIVRQTYAGNDQVVEVRPFVNGAARPPIVLPVATSPNVDTRLTAAIDASGRTYVAFSRERPPEPNQFFEGVGTELVVIRLIDGAIDTAFGSQGYASSTGRDLYERVSSESVSNNPTAIVLGPDGAPWVSAIVQSSTDAWDPNVQRPPDARQAAPVARMPSLRRALTV